MGEAEMLGRLKCATLAVMLCGCALAAASGAIAQTTTTSTGVPADLQRQNHLSHDRWARGEPAAPVRKSGGGGGGDGDNAPATTGPHKGELNGRLHMGEWP